MDHILAGFSRAVNFSSCSRKIISVSIMNSWKMVKIWRTIRSLRTVSTLGHAWEPSKKGFCQHNKMMTWTFITFWKKYCSGSLEKDYLLNKLCKIRGLPKAYPHKSGQSIQPSIVLSILKNRKKVARIRKILRAKATPERAKRRESWRIIRARRNKKTHLVKVDPRDNQNFRDIVVRHTATIISEAVKSMKKWSVIVFNDRGYVFYRIY